MKTIKPANMALFFRTHVLDRQEILSISAYAIFSFKPGSARLYDEQQLSTLVEANLAKDEIFDFGMPKPRGEFLVYGSCHAPKPVRGIAVHVQVAGLSKSLVVFGNRHWTRFGVSANQEFSSMPLSYGFAFGGEGYSFNPLGRGYAANNNDPLPNVENPDEPILSRTDCPRPAGFGSYSMTWPQRMQYLGKIDTNYVQECWPHLPKGTNPEYFNCAPFDQRLNGFFYGDEKFTLHNMHAEKSSQSSQLPGLRARIFVLQKQAGGKDIFKEVNSSAETLWLFPNQETGVLLYRASLGVVDDEYSDISNLYAVWENLADLPQSLEYYWAQLMSKISPQVEVLAEAVAVESEPLEEKVATNSPVSPAITLAPLAKDSKLSITYQKLADVEAELAAQLKKLTPNPSEAVQQVINSALAKSAPLAENDLNVVLKQIESQHADLINKSQYSAEDVAKLLTRETPADLCASIQSLSQLSFANPDFIANLTKLERLKPRPNERSVADEVANLNAKDPLPSGDENEPPLLSARDLSVADVMNLYQLNKDLSGLDLSNLDLNHLDLTAADFSNAVLENTNLNGAKLGKVIFINTRLSGASFDGSDLSSAVFDGVYASLASFDSANLSLCHISNSCFNECNFTFSNLTRGEVRQSIFENCVLTDSKATELLAENSRLLGCDLSRMIFVQAKLTGFDLSGSLINASNFYEINAPGLNLNGVTGSRPCFEHANLRGSKANEETLLTQVDFRKAHLSGAKWAATKLTNIDLSSAVLDYAIFSSCIFKDVKLELVSAKHTNFAKAQFINSDLNRINLFKGSLRRASLNQVNLSYSNLFGVDFYQTRIWQSNFTGANLERTVLSVLGGGFNAM